MNPLPSRGEIWLADLRPVRGHEQAGRRPVVVLSVDAYNHGPAGLMVVLPVTTTDRRIPLHIPLKTGEGGVKAPSFIMCDAIRSISSERILKPWGRIPSRVMRQVEDRVSILLGL